jgi:hypothetical protein
MKLKVYIAAAWHRQAEMAALAEELKAATGVEITSRWLHEVPAKGSKLKKDRSKRLWAKRDVADVRKADALIRFTDDLSREFVPAQWATGSRMVEMGIALERNMYVIAVGGYQPVFDYLPQVIHVRHLSELKNLLRSLNKKK